MASASAAVEQRNQDATVHVGGLDDRVNDDIVWELFTQAGPVVSVHMPKDKVTGLHQSYAFVEFRSEADAEYAAKIMNMVKLHGKPIRVSKASVDRARAAEVGANLFVGNLAPEVDEKVLYDTFSAFGGIVRASLLRDPATGASRGSGFVSYDSFEAADLAIECMAGQFLAERQVSVQYSYKKDARGERHGGAAERMLAAAARRSVLRPHTLFAAAPGQVTSSVPSGGGGQAMVGAGRAAAPLMLPPAAILPAGGLLPPPLPPPMQQAHFAPPPLLPPPGAGGPPIHAWGPPPLPPPLPYAAMGGGGGGYGGPPPPGPPFAPPGPHFYGGMPPPLPPPYYGGGPPPLPPPLPPPQYMR